jgi:cytochrome c-type biogenesis protein CcmH
VILPFLLAALTFAALLPVLLPLLRGVPPVRDRSEYDRAVYRDQLREVDRDMERGLLTETESGPVRLEIQRRLLATEPEAAPPRVAKARVLAAVTGIVAAAGALGLYLVLGVPVIPAISGHEAETSAAIGRLAEHLRTNPNDAEGWSLYARAMSQLERWDDAEAAWRHVIALGRSTPEVVAALGETLVLREGGTVSEEARGLFDMALRGDPKNAMARFYVALATSQGGDAKTAVAQWQALLDDMPPESPGRQEVAGRMQETARAAGIPLPSATGRTAATEAMAAKLAARLELEPNDAEGWINLGRSDTVLGRGAAAADAYEKAAALKPTDPMLRLLAAEALLANLKVDDPLPPRAIALLRQVRSALPDEPAVLWYLGLVAAREKQPDQARDDWTRLLKVLPADSEDAKTVRAALGALADKQ